LLLLLLLQQLKLLLSVSLTLNEPWQVSQHWSCPSRLQHS
jgi:hypothetical protein